MGPVVVSTVDPATAWGAYDRPSQSLIKVTRTGLDRSRGGCPSSGRLIRDSGVVVPVASSAGVISTR
jgi:hypothetical protein